MTEKRCHYALMDGAEAISPQGVAAIGQESGPVPFDVDQLDASD